MAIFAKEIIFITVLLTAGVFVSGQESAILGLNTNSTNEADVTEAKNGPSDNSEIKVDLAIGGTSLSEAIKIVNANKSEFVRLYPAGRLETLLKNVTAENIIVPLRLIEAGAPLIPTEKSTKAPTTQDPTTKKAPTTTPASETTTSIASETTTSPAYETTTSPASETTTSPASETTTSPTSKTTKSPAPETTRLPTTETTRLPTTETTSSPTTTPKPKPTPTPAPHHGLSRGEIAALVIFIIILFGVASGALVYYIRRRRMADDSYTQLVR